MKRLMTLMIVVTLLTANVSQATTFAICAANGRFGWAKVRNPNLHPDATSVEIQVALARARFFLQAVGGPAIVNKFQQAQACQFQFVVD